MLRKPSISMKIVVKPKKLIKGIKGHKVKKFGHSKKATKCLDNLPLVHWHKSNKKWKIVSNLFSKYLNFINHYCLTLIRSDPNWHEGWYLYFIFLSFLDQILSVVFSLIHSKLFDDKNWHQSSYSAELIKPFKICS